MQAADHLPHLFDRDVAREFLGLVLRLTGEAQDFGVIARVNQPRGGIVAAIVERRRLAFAAAPVGDEEACDALGESPLPHPLRPRQQPGMMDAAALPRFEKCLFGFLMADHGSHSARSARIAAVTSSVRRSASTIRQRPDSTAAISTKRAARRA